MGNREKIALGQYFSDLVCQEADLRGERDARTVRVLEKTLWITVALLAVWAVVYMFNGMWVGAMLNAVASALMLLSISMLRKRQLEPALHLVFWTALLTLWLTLICFDGPAGPVARMVHFWFIFLAAVGYMAFSPLGRGWQDRYATICGASFLLVHFDVMHLEVIYVLDQSVRSVASVIMLLVMVTLTSFLSWIFVSDILAGESRLDRANARLEELLENMLPHSIAQRLKKEGKTFADGFAEASILFAEIVDFANFADRNRPEVVLGTLDRIFSRFDELCERHGLEKIKTVGGIYMVVAGVPEVRSDHAEIMARFALDLLRAAALIDGLEIKIGINSGPVVAGVIGTSRLIYDLWGDSVNLAQRMQLHGVAGAVQISADTSRLLSGKFLLQARGKIAIKGKGEMETYLLIAELDAATALSADPAPPAPTPPAPTPLAQAGGSCDASGRTMK